MNRMVCAADVTLQECFEHLDEYIRNSGHDLDDYDMLKASKALHAYVRAYAGKLDEQAHAIGWLPLEVVAPETIDGILESCKRQDASDIGELGDEWMSVAERFIGCWNQLDRLFGTIADHFSVDDLTEDDGVWMFDANESDGCIPEDIWHSVWDTLGMMSTTFVVTIDGKSVYIGEGMYIAYRNGMFDGGGQGMARSVAMFLSSMENEALKHSIDPQYYLCKAYRQTGMPDTFWTTGTKED